MLLFLIRKTSTKKLIEVLQNTINKLEKEVYLLHKEKKNELWKDNELVSTLQNERKSMQKKLSRMEERLASGNYEKPTSISEGINAAMEAVIKKHFS